MKLESLCEYVDGYLRVADFPDYPNAYNGLQVQGRREVGLISAAVDASEAAINAAVERGSDLLLVHHGLFWDGRAPVTGRRFRKLAALLRNGVALYSAHLPLDAHPEVGNCGLLARALGIKIACGFGTYQGADVGWIGTTSETRESLRNRLADTLQVAVRLVDGGPEEVRRVAVVTGAGGSMIAEAARAGADAFITGEGAHHTYFDAMEYGINVYYAGHYATETLGVRALASHIEERFGIPWVFLEFPTGF
jgi:dinuclear metal center YbgI/SA1388 family protein